MSDIAIRVDKLSKRYRIGLREEMHDTFAASILHTLRQPLRNLRRLRSLTSFDEKQQDADDVLWALRDVSFDVKQGEVVGVIGRNGAGKSTLLKILSRITHPTGGRIEMRGRVSSLLEVGTGFHPELSGRENVYLNGTILGMRKTEVDRKFDEIVDFSGVEKFIDTPVKRYSSGMRVRLAFSVAAHLEPEILLVDEVLAVGDIEFQKKCLGRMGDVAKQGRTILFVSHNMAAVEALCLKSYVLDQGKLSFAGPTAQAIEKYVQSSIVSTSQDLAERTDRQGDGSIHFTKIDFEDSNGNLIENFSTGKDGVITLTYKADTRPRNVVVSLGIYSTFGQFLLLCDNEMVGEQFVELPLDGQIRCTIPRFPFAPGTYSLNIFCKVNGVLADWIQEACYFTVTEGDFYGTGRTPSIDHGGFLTLQKWNYYDASPNAETNKI